jgi:hypothetical protein
MGEVLTGGGEVGGEGWRVGGVPQHNGLTFVFSVNALKIMHLMYIYGQSAGNCYDQDSMFVLACLLVTGSSETLRGGGVQQRSERSKVTGMHLRGCPVDAPLVRQAESLGFRVRV